MDIVEVTDITAEVVSAFERLMPQLSGSAAPPTQAVLKRIAGSESAVLFLARDPERDGWIAGTLTLVLYRIPTGCRARIEDVVVDHAARRQGVGAALVEAALQRARRAGAVTVDLTTRPAREAANRLYLRLGFQRRRSNLYRYRLEPQLPEPHVHDA